jgi:hypothetical protein
MNNAVKPLIFGFESLGVAAGVSIDSTSRVLEWLTSPSQWNKNGITKLTADMEAFRDAADRTFSEIAKKYAGLGVGGAEITPPKLGAPYSGNSANSAKKSSGRKKNDQVSDEAERLRKLWIELNKEAFDSDQLTQKWRDTLFLFGGDIDAAGEAFKKAFGGDFKDSSKFDAAIEKGERLKGVWLELHKSATESDTATQKWADTIELFGGDIELAGEAFKKTFGEMNVETKKSATLFSEMFKGALGGIEGAFVKLATTGKLSIKDLVSSASADLARIAVRKGITDPLSGFLFGGGGGGGFLGDLLGNILPFANGGIVSAAGAMRLPSYASGGVASKPQLSLIGEAGMNEAYVPLPDGRSIPVTMQGGGGNKTINVTNNFSVKGQIDKRTETQLAAMVGASVQRAGRIT